MTSFSDDIMRGTEWVLHHLCLVLEIRLNGGTPTVLLVTPIKQQLFSSGCQGDQWDLKSFV